MRPGRREANDEALRPVPDTFEEEQQGRLS